MVKRKTFTHFYQPKETLVAWRTVLWEPSTSESKEITWNFQTPLKNLVDGLGVVVAVRDQIVVAIQQRGLPRSLLRTSGTIIDFTVKLDLYKRWKYFRLIKTQRSLPGCPDFGGWGRRGSGRDWAACSGKSGSQPPRQTGRWGPGSGEARTATGKGTPWCKACWDAEKMWSRVKI